MKPVGPFFQVEKFRKTALKFENGRSLGAGWAGQNVELVIVHTLPLGNDLGILSAPVRLV